MKITHDQDAIKLSGALRLSGEQLAAVIASACVWRAGQCFEPTWARSRTTAARAILELVVRYGTKHFEGRRWADRMSREAIDEALELGRRVAAALF